MNRYIARANIDHYISLLIGNDLTPHNRSIITTLLIAELDKLGHDLDHLDFAENRAANGRDRVNHLRIIRGSLTAGTAEHEQADRQLFHAENLLTLLDDVYHRLREKTKRAFGAD